MSKHQFRTSEPSLDQLTIEKLIYGGAGLARHEGQVVLVSKSLPGEVVRAEVLRGRSNLTEARLLEVLTPSPERVAAPCAHFDRCGGCHYQQMGYEAQLEAKRTILKELFERARLPLEKEIRTIAGEPFGYRNRTQFHFHDGRVGFREESSHRLVPVASCPVSSPKINEVLAILIRLARDQRFPKFLKSLEVFTNEEQVQLNVTETNAPIARHFFEWLEKEIPGVVHGAIPYPAAGFEWKVSYRSFFQVNRFLVDALADATMEGLAGAHVVDLYAGVGLFSIPAAKKFEQVTAVESGKGAMYDLEANSKVAGIENIRIVQANVDSYLADLTTPPDVMLADPPRSGLGKVAANELVRLAVPELRLVSCDPSTLVRDLGILLPGGYTIDDITLIDLFPQTFHIETITRLRRTR